jgi:hypothetical protein
MLETQAQDQLPFDTENLYEPKERLLITQKRGKRRRTSTERACLI